MKENIILGKEDTVSDEDVIHAAERSGVMGVIKNHPSGFDMHIGERGSGLSGGQRQGVSIARAMLGNPRVLIMDEPSNSMDNVTEMQLKSQLKEYAQDKTFILITHKASMLDIVDRLIVLDNGRVIADGEKNEVIAALQAG
jgi:ATP-binding cassette subfamily C protein LapB